jgi:hypothetical protein
MIAGLPEPFCLPSALRASVRLVAGQGIALPGILNRVAIREIRQLE